MQTPMRWAEADPLDLATLPEVARVAMHSALELVKETEAVLRSAEEGAEAVAHVVVVAADVESRDHDLFCILMSSTAC